MASSHAPDARASSVPAQIEHELESLLSEVNVLSLLLKRATRLHSPRGEVSAGEMSVLQVLARAGAQTVPQIARVRSTSRQNIQLLVNRLTGQGCVKSILNPEHKRSVLVDLTAQGRLLLIAAEQQQSNFVARLKPSVTPEQLQAAVQVLRCFRELLAERKGATERADYPPFPNPDQRTVQPEAGFSLPEEVAQEQNLPVNLL